MDEKESLTLKPLNYNSYLKIPELLSLQERISKPPHHDEMFFIIIHQAAELWFKEIIHETKVLNKSLEKGAVSTSLKVLKRITAIMGLLVDQIQLLNTLTPVEFAGFRERLNPASGFQSLQFRIMEFTYGLKEPFFLKFFEPDPEARDQLKKIRDEKSVYDYFLLSLKTSGFAVPEPLLNRDWSLPTQASPELQLLLKNIYENPGENFHWVLLFEALIDFDEKFSLWRQAHLIMVHRAIGYKAGTGGSTGFQFLKARADGRIFPDLWDVRNLMGQLEAK